MEEIWKDIEGFEGKYQISTYGRVKSLPRLDNKDRVVHGRILKPKREGGGYLQVCLCKNGQHYYIKIHRLVAKAFIPNPENKPTVNHLDENIKNNRLDNLEWATYKENANYGTRNERCYKNRDYVAIGRNIAKGRRLSSSCRKIYQLDKNKNVVNTWACIVDAAEETKYNRSALYRYAKHFKFSRTYNDYYWIYEEDYNKLKAVNS